MKSRLRNTIALAALTTLLATGCTEKPDLIVDHIVTQSWTNDQKMTNVALKNIGAARANDIRVYINLEEDPVSPNHRPQFVRVIEFLEPGQQVSYSVFWNHPDSGLQHEDNSFLGNATAVLVEIDPKDEIDEINELNNRSIHHLEP